MTKPLLALLLTACAPQGEWARAYKIEDLSEAVGGPKGLARPGDFVVENDRIRVAVLSDRPSMGNHTEGGSILDADLQRNSPAYRQGHGNDHLGEVFPSVNLQVARIRSDEGEVKIINDGSDGGPAIICTYGDGRGFITLLDVVRTLLGEFRLRTDYILDPGSSAIRVRTIVDPSKTITCDEAAPESTPALASDEPIPLIDIVTGGGYALGDFTLFGGAIDVFTPGVGFDEAGYVNELMADGVNTFVDPIVASYLGGSSNGVSYVYMPASGNLSVPMFTGSQTAGFGGFMTSEDVDANPGLVHYDRWLSVGRGDVGSALDGALEATGVATGSVQGWVVEKGTGVALSDVHVFAYKPGDEGPWTEWTTDIGDDPNPDGSFGGLLTPGRWDLVVHAEGRPTGPRVPITVSEGQTVSLVLESPQPGSVAFELTDETGQIIPGKVSFFDLNGRDVRREDLGDGHIGGHPAQVAFAPYGQGQIALPPGSYVAVASRGPEYDIDVSAPFHLTRNSHVELDLFLERTVDTWGWLSADFHVHAMPSPDSGVSLEDRVTTFVSEGVEFLASSDHDAITDYQPVIERMQMEPWLTSTPGTEVTTIELGHFLGFPLRWDPLGDQGGALDWTDMDPQEIIDGIRDLGEPKIADPLVIAAHPRDGILGYFSQYGFDPYTGTAGHPTAQPGTFTELSNDLISAAQFTMDFEAMEILNAKRFEMIRTPTADELERVAIDPGSVTTYDIIARTKDEQDDLIDGYYTLGTDYPGPIDDWFTLLNLGYRITALGNSDTHGTTKTEAGCPRNYVAIADDDPSTVTAAEVAQAVREGRVITSYGPFVRFGINEWANGPGSTVVDDDGVDLHIEVQSPSWFEVDRVELYENGTLVHEWNLEDDHDPLVDLATTIQAKPEKDSWYVVIALGADDLSPVFTPVDIMPIQLQDIVNGAIGEINLGIDLSDLVGGGAPIPRTFPIHPYAVTNPVWVDLDGDGFDPPGRPDWLVAPAEDDE